MSGDREGSDGLGVRPKVKPLGFFEAHEIVQSNKHRVDPWRYYGYSMLVAVAIDLVVGPVFVILSMYLIGGAMSERPSTLTFVAVLAACLAIWAAIGCAIYHLVNVRIILRNGLLEREESGEDHPPMGR